MRASDRKWDVFISHASEDKDDFVRPLAEALTACGLRVWYDEFTLTVGDRLRESIDQGLGQSRFGIVVLSPRFFDKQWPRDELDGLVTRERTGLKVILPVWLNITREQVEEFSPILANRVAVRAEEGLSRVIEALTQAIGSSSEKVESRRAGAESGTDLPPPSSVSRVRTAIRAWWAQGVVGVGLVAALTTAVVNLQAIRGWFIDTKSTGSVQRAPDSNVDEHATADPLASGSRTMSLGGEDRDPQTRPRAANPKLAAPADVGSGASLQHVPDAGGTTGDLAELASQMRKEVESLARPGEKWTVSEGPRISVTLYNPRDTSSGRGYEINASNRGDLESVMESLRTEWEDRHREDDEYTRTLLGR